MHEYLFQIQAGGDPSTHKYAGPVDCAKQLYREEGLFRGVYRGTMATLLRGTVICVGDHLCLPSSEEESPIMLTLFCVHDFTLPC